MPAPCQKKTRVGCTILIYFNIQFCHFDVFIFHFTRRGTPSEMKREKTDGVDRGYVSVRLGRKRELGACLNEHTDGRSEEGHLDHDLGSDIPPSSHTLLSPFVEGEWL